MPGTRAALLTLAVTMTVAAQPGVAQEKGDKAKNAKLRYDGLYLSEKQSNTFGGGWYEVWRFFADGTALLNSFPDYEEAQGVAWMASRLVPNTLGPSACKYTIAGNRIKITCDLHDLTELVYEGTIEGESLKLKWRSAGDDATKSTTAKFLPANFPPVEEDPGTSPAHTPKSTRSPEAATNNAPASDPPERTYGWHLSYRSLLLYLPVLLLAPALGAAAGRFWGGKRFFNTIGMVYTLYGCIGFILVAFIWLLFIVIGRAAGFQDQDGMAGFAFFVGLPTLYASAIYSQTVLNIGVGFHGTTASFSCGRCHARVSCWKFHLNQPHCPICGVYFDAVK